MENKKNGWKIFFYLTPLYIIVAYPLYNWHKKINSSDINLSKDDYSAFSSDEGRIKKNSFSKSHIPQLQDMGYSVNYKPTGDRGNEKDTRTYKRQKPETQKTNKKTKRKHQSNATKDKESIRDRETQYIGQKNGYLTSAVGTAMKNPKVVKALFNNPLVV
ncbi:MAG: hypothetical protein KKD69_02560, partial [Euryarchaeota archaeon]|nr:hypothetical protein [Euryarchaeota archaeon]